MKLVGVLLASQGFGSGARVSTSGELKAARRFLGKNYDLPLIIFDVAHNIESMRSFLKYYDSLNVFEDSVLIIALQERKQIQALSSIFQITFKYIICTETAGPHPMPADVLKKHFDNGRYIKTIQNPEKAIQYGLKKLTSHGGMAIIGSHYLGPAVSKVFKIYFDRF